MAQKINPTSVRLGKKLFWKFLFQNYGQKLCKYSEYHLAIWFSLFLVKTLQKQNIILTSNFAFLPSAISAIFIAPTINSQQNLLGVLACRQAWWPSNKIFLLFCNSNSTKSALFITSYFKHLIQVNFFFRKALVIITKILEQQLEQQKLIVTNSGLQRIVLKGFRLTLVGRFENTKTQMSKKLCHKSGLLSLNSLNSFVEYSSATVDSPLGVYNLKVWLFYC